MGLVGWEESVASSALRWVEPIGESGFCGTSKITQTSDWVEQIFRLVQDRTIPSILAPPSFSNFGISRADPLRIRSGNTKGTIITQPFFKTSGNTLQCSVAWIFITLEKVLFLSSDMIDHQHASSLSYEIEMVKQIIAVISAKKTHGFPTKFGQ